MRLGVMSFAFVAGLALVAQPARAADEDWPAITAAAREVNRQMNLFQELVISSPTLSMINGLFQQTMDYQSALIDLRRKVSDRASREQIYTSFDNAESKLNAILAEVKIAEQSDAGLRVVCKRVRSAEHDLHFAVYAGDSTGEGRSQRLYRQTLAQKAFIETLASNVNWVLAGSDALPAWKDDLGRLRQSLDALQRLEEKQGVAAGELKEQFLSTDKVWGKIVQRFDASRQYKVLLQGFVLMTDRGFARMAPLVGVNDRRPLLTDAFTD